MSAGRASPQITQEFLQQYAVTTGFVKLYPANHSPNHDDHTWKFHLSIFPTAENLSKAAAVLAPFLAEKNMAFKLLALNQGPQQIAANTCGKELCLYVNKRANSKRYEKTPAEIKTILLKVVHLLHEAQVDFGYAATPCGDKELTSGRFNLFTVSHVKAAEKINIKQSDLYRHARFTYLTSEDLREKRLRYLEANIASSEKQIADFKNEQHKQPLIINLLDHVNSDNYIETLQKEADVLLKRLTSATTVAEQDLAYEQFEQSRTVSFLFALCLRWPTKNDKNLSLSDAASALFNAIKNMRHYHQQPDAIKKLEFAIRTYYNSREEYYDENPELYAFFDKLSPPSTQEPIPFQNVYCKNPAGVQYLCRALANHPNEKHAYAKEQALQKIANELDAQILQVNSPRHATSANQQLAKALGKMRNELFKRIREIYAAETNVMRLQHNPEVQQINKLLIASKKMVSSVLSADLNKEQKLSAIRHFELETKRLPCLKKPTWRKVAQVVACVVLAAVCAVVGAVVGLALEGLLMAAISAPAGGSLGFFGAMHGAFAGGVTGWSIGMLGATSLGSALGTFLAVKHWSYPHSIENAVNAATKIATTRSR